MNALHKSVLNLESRDTRELKSIDFAASSPRSPMKIFHRLLLIRVTLAKDSTVRHRAWLSSAVMHLGTADAFSSSIKYLQVALASALVKAKDWRAINQCETKNV